jgi:hypothetical protein
MIKLIFYKGRTRLFNRAVSDWTRSPYSHCELVAEEHEDGTASCWSSSFQDGGVRLKRMRLHMENWDTLVVPGDLAAAIRWFEAHEGDKYDWFGLVGFVLRPVTGFKNRQFCSEAIAGARGMHQSWRFDPGTLYAALLDQEIKPELLIPPLPKLDYT